MRNYFLSKIKYEKTAEEGKIVKVTEQYLVDAFSFTEAEARITEEMTPFISGEFEVASLAKAKIHEIFYDGYGDKWYKSRIAFITLDEERGVEKRTLINVMVQASTLNDAENNLQLGMKGSMVDYEIVSVTETKILEVFNYDA